MKYRIAVAFVFAILATTEAFAWNALGHKVVAEIAWRQLEPDNRQRIADVLRRHPRFDADFAAKMTDDVLGADKATQDRWVFQHAAYWPDIARGLQGDELARYNRPAWHYITNPLFLDRSDRVLAVKMGITNSAEYPTDTPEDEYNVLQAIKHAKATLASQAGADQKTLAYCWLFHLVGDIHQPMHSTSLFSVTQFPLGDRGGNGIPLVGGQNLHSRWDGLLGRRDVIRNVDRQVAELSNREKYGGVWDSRAATILDPRAWAAESHRLCKTVVYSDAILDAVRHTPAETEITPIKLSEDYLQEAGDVARRRVIYAGLRLAALIKQ